jgi:branched-chain amino acid transport system ATP-binding protein
MTVQSSNDHTLLEVSGLTKRFGGVTAVDQMSLTMRFREVVALIGPNGAGKTTLFNIVSGISKPNNGDVFFQGNRVTGLPSWRMAELGIGRTFQNIRLFGDLTVLENVALARKSSWFRSLKLEDIKEVIERMGLIEFAAKTAGSLPYGLRRRVELARALSGRPKVILLDEPTAGMNPTEAIELVGIMRDIVKSDIGLLLIEHNMRVAMGAADRVVAMNLGRKIAEGSPEEIQQNSAVIQAYLGEGSEKPGNDE